MITLLLGGARSGKSELGERLAATAAVETGGKVTYLATLRSQDPDDCGDRGSGGAGGAHSRPYDPALAARIAAHQARRPAAWQTVEVGGDLPAVLARLDGTVLLDSLGAWLAGHRDFDVDKVALCDALRRRELAGAGDTIIVTDEVGLGVVPATAVGGAFRDALGLLNRAVAAVANRSFLVVAGHVVQLEKAPET